MTHKENSSAFRHQEGLSSAERYRRAIQREIEAFMVRERARLSDERRERARQLATRHKLPELDKLEAT
jgi:hypothetical protein